MFALQTLAGSAEAWLATHIQPGCGCLAAECSSAMPAGQRTINCKIMLAMESFVECRNWKMTPL